MTRAGYGADEVYTRMALGIADRMARACRRAPGLPIFHETGVLFFFAPRDRSLSSSSRSRCTAGSACRSSCSTSAALRRRFPMIDFAGDRRPASTSRGFGALMARRAVQTLVAEFVRAGGDYRQAAVAPPGRRGARCRTSSTAGGETLARRPLRLRLRPLARPGLPRPARPRASSRPGRRCSSSRPRPATRASSPGRLPGWADFNGGDIYYGFPDLEGRGFKIAHDAHGPPMDPDSGDRTPSAEALADVRAFMARRFPDLASPPAQRGARLPI